MRLAVVALAGLLLGGCGTGYIKCYSILQLDNGHACVVPFYHNSFGDWSRSDQANCFPEMDRAVGHIQALDLRVCGGN